MCAHEVIEMKFGILKILTVVTSAEEIGERSLRRGFLHCLGPFRLLEQNTID